MFSTSIANREPIRRKTWCKNVTKNKKFRFYVIFNETDFIRFLGAYLK